MVLRRQLRAQPQQAGGINTAHPLAASLVFCGVQSGGAYVDLVSGQVAAQTGTLDTVVLPSAAGSRAVGEARGLRPQANGYLKFAKQTGLDRLTSTGTVLCIAYSAGQDSAISQFAISSYEEIVGYYGFAFGFDDFSWTAHDGTLLRVSSAAGNTINSSGAVLGAPHANKLHAMGGAWDGTSNYLYYNSLTRQTIAGIRTPAADANRRTNINRMSVSSAGTTGNVLCVGFNRVLTQAEYRAWALAPWAILAPTPRRFWLGPPDATVIAFDAASNSGYQAASAGYTFNRTVAGSNRFLVVDVALLSAGQTVTSITDDSTGTPAALTLVGVQTSVTGTGRTESWGLVAPALGTKTVSVVLSGSVASSSAAVSYIGAHQTTPTEAWNSASATNVGAADATVTITPVASNTWIHGLVATDDAAITANQTSRNNVSGVGGSGADEDTGPIASPTPTVMSYTAVAALATWVMAGFAIRPASASGSGITGTGASTQAANTSAASGTVAISGTAADAQAANASSGTGAVAISGAAADAQASNTSAAAGAIGVSGTGASDQATNSSTAGGTVTVSGAGASTQALNAAAASGTVLVSGSAALTQAANSSAASGTVTVAGPIIGTGASTNAPNISAANGSASQPAAPSPGPAPAPAVTVARAAKAPAAIKLTPPRSDIPIGSINIDGQKYDATINSEWLRYLNQGLFDRVGGFAAPTNNDLDSFLQFDIREADSAELQKRVYDLEVAAESSNTAWRAELTKRMDDMEISLSTIDALLSQIAQLSARLADQETSGAFR